MGYSWKRLEKARLKGQAQANSLEQWNAEKAPWETTSRYPRALPDYWAT